METEQPRNIILASGSPRRLELMRRIGFVPRVVSADIVEERGNESPHDYTRRLAEEKSAAVAEREKGADEDWILAADTIVLLDGEVLEKPVDRDDAIRMLSELSGKTHTVVTSFCWRKLDGQFRTETVTADVHMKPISPDWIARYVDSGDPMDKAGAYGIQGVGATFVRSITGSYFCVMGLPVCEVVETLSELTDLDFPFND